MVFIIIALVASVAIVLFTDMIEEMNMDKIELTEEQKQMVFNALDDVQGAFDEYLEVGKGIIVHMHGVLDINGYREKGTGVFVETSRIADVSLDATIADDEGNEEDYELPDEFCKECWDYLQNVRLEN